MKFSDSSKTWQRFRLVAIPTVIFFVIVCVAFLVSFFKGRETIVVDGLERTYYIHLPSSYDEETPYPLLMVFHMRIGNAWIMRDVTQFNELANQEGFIVIYPDGYRRSWADGSQRYEADQAGIDDLLFVQTLLASLSSRFSIDERRIYATGFSNGGFFAQRLGCELSEQIRAVATVGAVLPEAVLESCEPSRAVPMLMIHGRADQDMPWEGKPPQLASVSRTVQNWVDINRCSPTPAVELFDPVNDATQVKQETYSGCQNDADVILYTIEEGGHKWPGGSNRLQYWLSGNRSQDIDATTEIWAFFENHAK